MKESRTQRDVKNMQLSKGQSTSEFKDAEKMVAILKRLSVAKEELPTLYWDAGKDPWRAGTIHLVYKKYKFS